ncbi:hypothetical protein [Aerosakkonema funiforme]|uniref:hypothetical protein n=1 Tax=Aerosakkonema funiforme TaxID=1246630 RepID=UPI0035BBCC17
MLKRLCLSVDLQAVNTYISGQFAVTEMIRQKICEPSKSDPNRSNSFAGSELHTTTISVNFSIKCIQDY